MRNLSINEVIDNTLKIKSEAANATRLIDFIDSTVTPIGKFATPPSK